MHGRIELFTATPGGTLATNCYQLAGSACANKFAEQSEGTPGSFIGRKYLYQFIIEKSNEKSNTKISLIIKYSLVYCRIFIHSVFDKIVDDISKIFSIRQDKNTTVYHGRELSISIYKNDNLFNWKNIAQLEYVQLNPEVKVLQSEQKIYTEMTGKLESLANQLNKKN
jgi:hypothetical protein